MASKKKTSGDTEVAGLDKVSPSLDKLSLRDVLRIPAGVDKARDYLEEHPADDTPAGPSKRSEAEGHLAEYVEPLTELQERLFAHAQRTDEHRVLVVLQGMDTAGKGGTIEHAMGLVNPTWLKIHGFKAPTKEELQHDFLWRIEKALPGPGQIGIFDRSHYEDVLIARVRQLAPPEEIERRYGAINDFEARLVNEGYTIIKCFLRISYEEQRERLLARLDDPTKHWKFNEGDIDERELWSDYQAAYVEAIGRCNSDAAPWYHIPADRKWYRNWAVGRLLLETLHELNPQYPDMDLDIERLKARLAD